MLVGMDVLLPLVQHLHALTCQFKISKRIDSIGLIFEPNSIADVDGLQKYPAVVKYSAIHSVVCMQSKQHPGAFILPCKTIDFQQIDKRCSSAESSNIVHFAHSIVFGANRIWGQGIVVFGANLIAIARI